MPTDTGSEARPRQARPWLRSLLRSLPVSVAVVVGYFVLPLSLAFSLGSGLVLVTGTAVLAGLVAWEVYAITVAPYPRAQAFEAVALAVPLFFVVFATTYHLMARADPHSWSEPLSRLDALYFTITVFATVGFGDIHAISTAARAVVTVQMVLNLVLIGLITRVVVGAVQKGLSRRAGQPEQR